MSDIECAPTPSPRRSPRGASTSTVTEYRNPEYVAIVPAVVNGKTMLNEKTLEVYNDCKRKQRTAWGGIWKNWEVKMLRDDEGVPNNVGLECNECKEVHTYSRSSTMWAALHMLWH